MSKRLKVATTVGTRPEIIRLSSVMRRLDESLAVDHIIIHTGQNYDYELNEIFFEDFNLRRPDYFLDAAGKTAMETIGNTISKMDQLLDQLKPDAFLILGDTNSCLSAIAAKRKQIPIFHMEAGNRCFDQRVPEETNRKIVDHLADVNLPYSSIAREYLIHEGFPADQIIKIGSPMKEVLMKSLENIKKSTILDQLKIKTRDYFLVSLHRDENVTSDSSFNKFVDIIQHISKYSNKKIIISTHPRTKKKIKELDVRFSSQVQLMKPFGFYDYNKLQQEAYVTLSDSGTISEESSILGFKALNLRETHERPEAMEEAAVIMTGLNKERILQALECINNGNHIKFIADYEIENVSHKVERILLSYTDYINRKVWRRYER